MLFRQWFPQIVDNQHQTGTEAMAVFVPPFRDPFNFNHDPIVMTESSEVVGLADAIAAARLRAVAAKARFGASG